MIRDLAAGTARNQAADEPFRIRNGSAIALAGRFCEDSGALFGHYAGRPQNSLQKNS
jgi:hypothetical protein